MGRGSTLCGLEDPSCPRSPRFRRCGSPRTNMMSLVLKLSTECASEVMMLRILMRSIFCFFWFLLRTAWVVCLYAMYCRSPQFVCCTGGLYLGFDRVPCVLTRPPTRFVVEVWS